MKVEAIISLLILALYGLVVGLTVTSCTKERFYKLAPEKLPGDTLEVVLPCPPAEPETVYVEVPPVPCEPETVYIYTEPNWECVEDCVAINGLGHWRECLGACLEAR